MPTGVTWHRQSFYCRPGGATHLRSGTATDGGGRGEGRRLRHQQGCAQQRTARQCVAKARPAEAKRTGASCLRRRPERRACRRRRFGAAVLIFCASVEGRKTATLSRFFLCTLVTRASSTPVGHSLDISHASSSACASLLVSPKSRPACCCRSSSSPTRVRRSCQSASVAARSASVCSGLRLGCNASGSQPSRAG